MKKVLSIFLVFAMVLSLSVVTFADDTVKITIVHTNDTHARVESSSTSLGFAKIATYVKQLREENPNLLLLDAGDTFHGQTIATLNFGEAITGVLNVLKYDVMTVGNHDFNYGTPRLLELRDMLNFDMVAANVLKGDESLFEPYVIKEVAGVTFGIFGLATPETAYKTHPKYVEGLTFADPIAYSQKMVDELKGKVDIIIALGHIGDDEGSEVTSIDIINAVDGIDIFVDGHSHTTHEKGKMVKETLLVQAGEYDQNLGIVELTVKDGKIVTKEARLLTYEEALELEEDPETLAVIAEYKAANDLITKVKVGETSVVLEGAREVVRTGESNLGNLITNAMLFETGAKIAITNGGGIRSSIPAGDVTVGDVLTVLPFNNIIMTLEMKGSDIIKALEVGAAVYPATNGAFSHVAGLTYTFDPSKPAHSRIVDVLVDGKPIDNDAYYMVATNDFLAGGGDGYTVFKEYPQAGLFATLDEALIKYMKTIDVSTVAVEGRIVALEVAEEAEEQVTYTILAGDVLWKIAQKYGTTWQALAELNNLANPHLIFPGHVLVVPAP